MKLLGVCLNPISLEGFDLNFRSFMAGERSQCMHVVTVNPEYLVEAFGNHVFRDVLNKADFSLIDGFGLLLAMKIRYPGGEYERVTGVDMILHLVRQEWMKGGKVYLLGAGEGVANKAAERLREIARDVVFVADNGHKDIRMSVNSSDLTVEDRDVIGRINKQLPDVLLVAYGHPWQDLWISKVMFRLDKPCLVIGVGGSFDYISGNVMRAPAWMRSIGLEWLFRLIRQPRRLARIFDAVVVFPFLVLRSKITEK